MRQTTATVGLFGTALFLCLVVSLTLATERYILVPVFFSLFAFFVLVKHLEWFPVLLLPAIWYIPPQTAPGGPLEDYVLFRWFSLIAILTISVIQLGRSALLRRPIVATPLAKPFAALAATALLSAILNGKSFPELVGFLVLYLQYPLFFLLLMNTGVRHKVMKNFVLLLLVLTFVTVPEVFIRFLAIGVTGDGISAILGAWGTYNIGVFAIYAVALVTGHALSRGQRIYHYLAVGSLLGIGIIGEIKILILSTPFVVLATTMASSHLRGPGLIWNVRRVIIASAVLLLVLLAYNEWGSLYQGENLLSEFVDSVTNVFSRSTFDRHDLYNINRIGPVVMVLDLLRSGPLTLLFGLGPGSSLAGNFFGSAGTLFEVMPESFMLTQISATLADLGLLGCAVYMWIFLVFFKIVRNARVLANEGFERVVVIGSFGVLFFYAVLGPIYNIIWRSDAPGCVFYVLMAFATQIAGQRRVPSAGMKAGVSL